MTTSLADNARDGDGQPPVAEPAQTVVLEPGERAPVHEREASPQRFATRADARAVQGATRGRLLLLGGGLAVAIAFFVLTTIVGRSPQRPVESRPASRPQQERVPQTASPKGSVTPVMEAPRLEAPDSGGDQVAPGDVLRTRSLDPSSTGGSEPGPGGASSTGSRPAAARSLGEVPSFAETQQRFEDPAPDHPGLPPETQPSHENSLKEPSLVFVRSAIQSPSPQIPTSRKAATDVDPVPRFELTPGTRIEAKLETEISSAVPAPVVAVVTRHEASPVELRKAAPNGQ